MGDKARLISKWVIPEKTRQVGLRIWNFQGYLRNSKWNLEFSGVVKKKSYEISRGLGSRP